MAPSQQPANTSVSPKSPTASEIADEVIKKLPKPSPLKIKALGLVRGLFDFMRQRSQLKASSPPPPTRSSFSSVEEFLGAQRRYMAQQYHFDLETEKQFRHDYGSEVTNLTVALKEEGVLNSNACDPPTSEYGITDVIACATAIQGAANKLR